ncbi:hypothetical protein CXB51_007791 [Gossypium anomalum]|uniref:Zinc knuckle CX2CX4HX4C domain-containing protein n=1 Tax=Gossypium anomalum TaxID=47600 RepID=A0A8J5YUV9_9ROSI|nr:hypothetical protein CXB51_007791 [Gossypium anomalum]
MENEMANLSLEDGEEEILVVPKESGSQSRMDLERVVNGAPWNFNNHLLMFHRLEIGEDPVKVPSIFVNFGVQVHELPMGLFSEALDVRRPLKRKKKIMFAPGNCAHVSFRYEKLTMFCFYCGRLGHSDSFCQIKMSKGEESIELSRDLSLQAQPRRVDAMSSVWGKRERGADRGHVDMEHDVNETLIESVDGKKRPRKEIGNYVIFGIENSIVTCLTLAYISRPMHVPDMSYTSSRLNADAMSQTWSYTGSHNVADACLRHRMENYFRPKGIVDDAVKGQFYPEFAEEEAWAKLQGITQRGTNGLKPWVRQEVEHRGVQKLSEATTVAESVVKLGLEKDKLGSSKSEERGVCEENHKKDNNDGNGNDDNGGNEKPRVGKKKPKRKRDKLK